jgi:hypothetical protein
MIAANAPNRIPLTVVLMSTSLSKAASVGFSSAFDGKKLAPARPRSPSRLMKFF